MKRILFALSMVGCLLSLGPRAEAATEVSINFFYDNLTPYGNWIEVGDYGYCFQPNVAVNNSSWRPYADGYWAYTDVGWTWISYEDFGWATYHYGRWANLADYGWVWVPGYEWGPAWVSWRTGGDYIGWAPLPPAREYVYEGRPITGHVDVEFNIGPLFYNFVDIRYVGEPVLRERIIAPQQNVTIINRTVNVTNITYNNSTVYNYGPDLDRVNQFSTRPVQHLSIQRETNVTENVQGGRKNLNRVNGDQFVVVAPKVQKSTQQVAPKQVKAKVQQPKVERGWQGVSNREQLETAMKNENPKNVPPPSFQPQKGTAAAGNTAQPNEVKPASENAATATEAGQRENERTARQAERKNRGQTATQQNPNVTQDEATNRQAKREQRRGRQSPPDSPNQPSADQDQTNARNSGKTEQTYNRPNRAPRSQRNSYQPESSPSMEQRDQDGQSREGRDQVGRRQNGKDEEAGQGERDRKSENAQAQRDRPQRQEASQPQSKRAEQNRTGNDVEVPSQRERAQQPQGPPQRERAPEARPRPQQSQPQSQGDQDEQRKGKKKKPSEEPSPNP